MTGTRAIPVRCLNCWHDHLEIEGTLASGTHVLLTTPSAGKFYRVLPGRWQRQQVQWSIKSGASLAWVPQENIFFRGSAQRVLLQFIPLAETVCATASRLEDDEIGYSLPGLAILSSNHEQQSSRLFRS